ncbi:NCAM2 protein, partial [Amia calva]|nr:NCAM2 protein [Amia calva]
MGWGFGQQPTNVTARRGSSITLTCRPPHSRPPASITWFKNNRVLNKMPHFMFQESGDLFFQRSQNITLYISAVRAYDEGTYTCEATNALGQSRLSATLRVAVPPIIISFIKEINCSEGSSVVLVCEAAGDLPIKYSWNKEGNKTSISSPRMHINEHGALSIENVSRADGGVYHCTAENRAGREQRTATLTVTELSWQPPFMDHGAPGAYKISYSTVQTIPTPAVSALSAEVEEKDPYLPLTVRVTTAPSETTELSPSQAAKSSKTGKAELTEWPKENTSQSPMRTSDNDMARDPKQTSWVPVLEKHDIPIVVGVGISLTLIFITMGFYSLVQKNEAGEAETGRGCECVQMMCDYHRSHTGIAN